MFHFSRQEKIEFLERRGFNVEERVVKMAWNTYHNDVDYEDVTVLAVLDYAGNPYKRPMAPNFKKEEWLEAAFVAQLNIVFKEIVLGIPEAKAEKPGLLDQVLEP